MRHRFLGGPLRARLLRAAALLIAPSILGCGAEPAPEPASNAGTISQPEAKAGPNGKSAPPAAGKIQRPPE